jgi:hypothetical protein
MRGVGILLVGLLFFLNKYLAVFHHITWVFLGVFGYLLIIDRVQESQNYLVLSHLYTMVVVTMFTGMSAMRFLQTVIMGVLVGVLGVVGIIRLGML